MIISFVQTKKGARVQGEATLFFWHPSYHNNYLQDILNKMNSSKDSRKRKKLFSILEKPHSGSNKGSATWDQIENISCVIGNLHVQLHRCIVIYKLLQRVLFLLILFFVFIWKQLNQNICNLEQGSQQSWMPWKEMWFFAHQNVPLNYGTLSPRRLVYSLL